MLELLQCCLWIFCLTIFLCLVIVSLAIGGYGYKSARYVYDHDGHLEVKSIVSLLTQSNGYDLALSIYVTLAWVGALVLFVIVVLACFVVVKITVKQSCRAMFSCCRPARNSLSRRHRDDDDEEDQYL